MATGKKTLYFDCSSGISGDMTLGALLDLGADRELFLSELEKLHLDGYRIEFEQTQRHAITATHVNVILTGDPEDGGHEHEHETEDHAHEDTHAHDHSHDEDHAHDGDHAHADAHIHGCEHDQEHATEHEHMHDHNHNHDHSHTHTHRSYRDIKRIIGESTLDAEVKDLALRIFDRVARAEAKVHHRSVEEVQFHEVGAVDSIVDIVGCAILICQLRPDRICASIVQDGHGFIECQHGTLAVPVPAVSEIFAEAKVKLRQIDVDTELVTPTGAAIIAELADSFGPIPQMQLEQIGWGAGTKQLKQIPNLLKVYLGQEEDSEQQADTPEEIMVLQTNLDDCSGELLGAAMEILLAEGALDVFYTPIYMKKSRPAWMLTVLCRIGDTDRMEQLIFRHTTTIGIRKRRETRTVLQREAGTVQTPYGELQVKRVWADGELRSYPEYESAVKLAKETGRSLWEITRSYE